MEQNRISKRSYQYRDIMKCKHTKKMVSLYVDDALGPDEKESFGLHLQDCARCREELEEFRTIHQMFSAAEEFSAPHGFATRVMANLETEEPSWLQKVLGLRPFFLKSAEVAIAVVVMAVGIFTGNLLLEEKMPPHSQATLQETFSLDLFQAAPPDSIAGIYLAYAGGER
jgi:anti-sigma factor RsiW